MQYNENNYKIDSNTLVYAITSRRKESLKFLYTKHTSWDRISVFSLMRHTTLECLKYFVKHGGVLKYLVRDLSIIETIDADVFQFIIDKQGHNHEQIMKRAITYGRTDLIEILNKKGIPIDESYMKEFFLTNTQLKVINFMKEKNMTINLY